MAGHALNCGLISSANSDVDSVDKTSGISPQVERLGFRS